MKMLKNHFTITLPLLVSGVLLLSACQPVQAIPTVPINEVSFEVADAMQLAPQHGGDVGRVDRLD